MAQTDTPQPTPRTSPPADPAKRAARQHRWLAACVLLIAASAVVVLVRHARSGSSSAAQDETCPAPGETAASCPLPEGSAATPEPFPAQAEAQVAWVLRYQRPAMILFYSELCRPCMMMDALVQMVRRDYEPAVTFIEVVGDNPANAALVHRMGVGTVPTSFFLTPSGESKRVIGLMKQQDLRAELARLAALAPTPTGTPSP